MRKIKSDNKNKKAILDQPKCDKSPFCPSKKACPVNAIVPLKDGEKTKKNIFSFLAGSGYKIDKEKCTGCGLCIRVCARGAITLG